MSVNKQSLTQVFGRSTINPTISLVKELLIWNRAWQEYFRLQRLDTDALRDMGITDGARNSVTVSRIASRILSVPSPTTSPVLSGISNETRTWLWAPRL